MFEQAVRLKLRFNYRGLVSVEDLWDLSVQDLDFIYKELNIRLKEQSEESLLEKKSQSDKILELKIEIIKYIVNVKLEEQKIKEDAILKSEKKQKLFKLIAEKRDENLKSLPVEELEKMVDEL